MDKEDKIEARREKIAHVRAKCGMSLKAIARLYANWRCSEDPGRYDVFKPCVAWIQKLVADVAKEYPKLEDRKERVQMCLEAIAEQAGGIPDEDLEVLEDVLHHVIGGWRIRRRFKSPIPQIKRT